MVTDDEDWVPEEVERRREVRGLFPGLRITLVDAQATFAAVEASRRGFFVRVDDPDRFVLGEVHEAVVAHEAREAKLRLEVVRKEIEPRKGIALRIAHMSPEAEATLKEILGPVG